MIRADYKRTLTHTRNARTSENLHSPQQNISGVQFAGSEPCTKLSLQSEKDTPASETPQLLTEQHCVDAEDSVGTSHLQANEMDPACQLYAGKALQELLESDADIGNDAFPFLTNADIKLLLTVSLPFGKCIVERLVSKKRQRFPAISRFDG